MARSTLTETTTDLISDAGSVLWSIVRGEQLEFPVDLDFATTAFSGYTFEAVVIEADNVQGSSDMPSDIKAGGVQTLLVVRIPTFRNNWDSLQGYNTQEVVYYNLKYYYLSYGVARINATTPDQDPTWVETKGNRVYMQFAKTLSATWTATPTVTSATYGFFELRVTENSGSFPRTWKPVRGMVQILFSPTEVVPDV